MSRIGKILREQSGISILFFAFSVVVLFAMVALGVDGGNLYLSRLRLQKAVDSGTLTALSYRIQYTPQLRDPVNPDNADGTPNYRCPYNAGKIDQGCIQGIIEPMAETSINENMQTMGVQISPTGARAEVTYCDCRPGNNCADGNGNNLCNDPVPTANNEYELFATNVSYDVPLLLIHRLPFSVLGSANYSGNTVQMSVATKAKLPPVNVALLVDNSESMACPFNTPNCDCLNTNSCPANTQKITQLKTALKIFINNFRPDRDVLTLLPFNLQTDPTSLTVSARQTDFASGNGFNLGAFQAKIDSLIPKTNTNPADALIAAYHDFRSNLVIGDEAQALARGTNGQAFYVLFTDGAPTATTAYFNGSAASNPVTNYEIEWRTTALENTNNMLASLDPNFVPKEKTLSSESNFGQILNCTTQQLNQCISLGKCSPVPETVVKFRINGCKLNDDDGICQGAPCTPVCTIQNQQQCFAEFTCHIQTDSDSQYGIFQNCQAAPQCNGVICAGVTSTTTTTTTTLSTTTTTNPSAYSGPAAIIQTSFYPLPPGSNTKFGLLYNKAVGGALPAGVVAVAPSKITFDKDNFYTNAFPGFGNFGFNVPSKAPGRSYICTSCFYNSATPPPFSYDNAFWNDQVYGFKKVYYNNLITIADFIRAEKGFVFTIGLGNPAPVATNADPYQDLNNNDGRKDNLLARVAADTTSGKVVADYPFRSSFVSYDPATSINTCTADDPVTGLVGCDQWKRNGDFHGRFGNYTGTTNATELANIYQAIARKIQLQVVQ